MGFGVRGWWSGRRVGAALRRGWLSPSDRDEKRSPHSSHTRIPHVAGPEYGREIGAVATVATTSTTNHPIMSTPVGRD